MIAQPETSTILGAGVADTAGTIQNAQSNQLNNEQASINILKSQYEAMNAREKSRLSSVVIGASRLKPYLDNGDKDGALEFLKRRQSGLHDRMAGGEMIDTEDTDYAIKMLESGDIEGLKNDVHGILAAGRVYGLYDATQTSPYIAQFNAIKTANPNWSDSQVWDYVYTRGQVGKAQDFGADGKVINAPGSVDAASEMGAGKAFGEETGSSAGKQVIANDQAIGSLNTLGQAVSAAEQSLAAASSTGPLFGRVGAAAKDPQYINFQRDVNEITLLAKDLYNLGSGQGFTDADRDFLQELAGGRYNRQESAQYALDRFKAAIQNRRAFLENQNQRYQQTYGQGQTAQPQGGGQQMASPQGEAPIAVTNPSTGETAYVLPSRLREAEAEGFKRQ